MSRDSRSPGLARWLLARLLPRDEREFVIGDLEETCLARHAAGDDLRTIRRWYWRTAFGVAAAFAAAKPRAHQRHDDRHEPRRKGDGPMKNILRDW